MYPHFQYRRGVRRRLLLFVVVTALMSQVMPSGLVPQRAAAATELEVYGDSLNTGWSNWSWSTTVNFTAPSPVYTGSAATSVTISGAWAALYLHSGTLIPISSYSTLRFWIHGGSQGGQVLQVKLADANGNFSAGATVTPAAGAWTLVSLPLITLGNVQQISGIAWQDWQGAAQPTFYLDQISLITETYTPTATLPLISGPALSVNSSAGRHNISADIYGINYADETLAAELRLPVRRWGGNAATRYNWQNDTSNRASDWFFENVPEDNADPAALPDGSSANRAIQQNQRTGTQTLLTIPMIGYTPKDRSYACAFSVAKYGAQQYTDSYRPDCGNGVRPDGSRITGNNPTDTSNPIDPGFVQNWVSYLVSHWGTASQGGVRYYNLDNEPMLWDSTHRDVHPNPVGYDELRDLTYRYAAAIKAVDPGAQTLGPVLWGWTAYFYSALDGAPGGSWWLNPQDRNAHGGVPFTEWYLQQMRAYEQQHGQRILDYLDLHYYPQASGVALSGAGDSATQALRLRSVRSLWDPIYVDESWINEPVRLIPRMHDWVNQNYPGTRLAISEYNWGALDDMNGALAQADVLGIFGREGLDLAALWAPPAATDPGAFAFRIYRNYDGAGSQFGDVSVHASSTQQDQLAVYAAQRSSDGALTLVVINKTSNDRTSALTLSGCTPSAAAQVYRYSPANLGAIVRLPNQAVSAGGFSATYPASSITLIVLPASISDPVPTATATQTSAPPPTTTPTSTRTETPLSTATPTLTVTPSPTSTGRPTGTPSPFPAGTTAHIGDLSGLGAKMPAQQWQAKVTVLVHDEHHNPVANVTVSGAWRNGSATTGATLANAACTTDATGQCSVAQSGLSRRQQGSVTFTVSGLAKVSMSYSAAANHDPDGSNGTSITVLAP